MTREEAINKWVIPSIKNTWNEKKCDEIIKALEQELSNDMASRRVFEQVMWERDIAISQLKELGYGFGEKIEPCKDAIRRQAVLDLAKKGVLVSNGNYKSVCKAINELPPVNPQNSKMDLDELKRRILMEVDGGTDDRMLRYCDVCDRISNSIDKYREESGG